MSSDGTIFVYRDTNGLFHHPGLYPGTPYTACLLDAEAMTGHDHPVDDAGKWCSRCLALLASGFVYPPPSVPAERNE